MIDECFGPSDMAAWAELRDIVAGMERAPTVVYRSKPTKDLAEWSAQAAAGQAVLVNVKGMRCDDLPVVLSLREYRRLVALEPSGWLEIATPDQG